MEPLSTTFERLLKKVKRYKEKHRERQWFPYGYTLAYPGTQEYGRILNAWRLGNTDSRRGSKEHLRLLKRMIDKRKCIASGNACGKTSLAEIKSYQDQMVNN